MMTKANPRYLETLLLYYEEEIEGEAYFAELARASDDPDHAEKLRLLADVERHAARAVLPLIRRHGLEPRASEDLVASGRAEARATPAGWAALLEGMIATYPGYLEAFRRLEAMGPEEDRPRLSFLTGHEAAAIDFLDLEMSGSADSAAPLRSFLDRRPETRGSAAE